jgi:hypothetical protein
VKFSGIFEDFLPAESRESASLTLHKYKSKVQEDFPGFPGFPGFLAITGMSSIIICPYQYIHIYMFILFFRKNENLNKQTPPSLWRGWSDEKPNMMPQKPIGLYN